MVQTLQLLAETPATQCFVGYGERRGVGQKLFCQQQKHMSHKSKQNKKQNKKYAKQKTKQKIYIYLRAIFPRRVKAHQGFAQRMHYRSCLQRELSLHHIGSQSNVLDHLATTPRKFFLILKIIPKKSL